uniref:NADH dehydrogenase [ubiquinone] 1 beta subcomplex subunit 4 n=1 Tax=Sphenodon punctatus TaxID=8508 RepID=A0A8D0G0W5_SPHPU
MSCRYVPSPFAMLLATLDPRLAIRARLKHEFQLKLNDPQHPQIIEDPAMTHWVYARMNIYPNFHPTPKNSLLGAFWGIGPVLFWWSIFKTERDYRERLMKEGKYEWSPFQICS